MLITPLSYSSLGACVFSLILAGGMANQVSGIPIFTLNSTSFDPLPQPFSQSSEGINSNCLIVKCWSSAEKGCRTSVKCYSWHRPEPGMEIHQQKVQTQRKPFVNSPPQIGIGRGVSPAAGTSQVTQIAGGEADKHECIAPLSNIHLPQKFMSPLSDSGLLPED